jgi:DNA-binding NarL/FixJ family response regulator
MTFPVFLVEDDPKLRDAIGESINAICDAEVIGTAETEAHAVTWLNEHPNQWKLAVLDLFLKVGTGFGVLARLVPAASSGHVIVLTNSATNENRERCLALGALAVYDKTSELDKFLDHCLRHHQQTA